MKKRVLGLLLLLAIWTVSLTGCSVPTLQKDGETFFHSQNGVSYRYAPTAYTARAVSEDSVAKIEREIAEDLPLYAVEGVPTERCLATADGTLLCAVDWELPTLFELSVSEAIVYETQTHSAVARVSAASDLTMIKETWNNEPRFSVDEILPSVSIVTYDVCFVASGAYDGLVYGIKYFRCSDEILLYDAVTDTDSYESIYSGIPMTFEEYQASDDGVAEVYAVYHFGTELFYDVSGGWCCRADAVTSDWNW